MKAVLTLVGVLCLVVGSNARANLVLNSSFETGAAQWSFSGSAYVDTHDPGYARSGSLMGYVNMFSPAAGTISQSINTVPGQAYVVSMWIAQNGSANATVSLSFGGTLIDTFYVDGSSVPVAPTYREIRGVVVAASAISDLVFSANTVNQTVFVDDFSVAEVSEPGAVPLVSSALLALLLYRRGRVSRRATAH